MFKKAHLNLGIVDARKIEMVLEEIGLLDKYKQNELECGMCHGKVTKSNLRAVYWIDNIPHVGCSNDRCYRETVEYIHTH